MAFKAAFSILFLILLAAGCQSGDTAKTEKEKADSSLSATDSSPLTDTLVGLQKTPEPVFGDRLVITGDFDGDGSKESLKERYVSMNDYKETYKDYTGMDYEELIPLIISQRPYSYLLSDDLEMDTLRISKEPQLYGLSFLKNEGDLNGDGTDEISYVINWADFSSMNTWHIVTCRNGKWEEVYSFSIWDWQLFREEDEPEFSGLVRKLGNKKIEVIYRTNEADMDTMVVKLN